ncbi:5900_t:CDS:1, partial [Dentiscutata heterogama]
ECTNDQKLADCVIAQRLVSNDDVEASSFVFCIFDNLDSLNNLDDKVAE